MWIKKVASRDPHPLVRFVLSRTVAKVDSIGFVTPYAKYTGKAELILESRKTKLQQARERRVKANLERIENEKLFQHKKVA